jgi:DNA repair photolyase
MEEGLYIKENALEILEIELARKALKRNAYGIVAVGTATDAYIHHEEKMEITRGMLQLLLKYRFPVFISTKCLLIKRDIDLLKEIDKMAILPDDLKDKLPGGVILSVSLSSLDTKVTHMLEPGAAPPLQRLQMVSELKQQGFLVGVNAMPLLPFISDTEEEMEKIIVAAKDHGADYILAGGLTLFGSGPADSKTLYYKFLERYDATLLPHYEQLYGSSFYTSFSYQEELKRRAERLCKKHNIRNGILA